MKVFVTGHRDYIGAYPVIEGGRFIRPQTLAKRMALLASAATR